MHRCLTSFRREFGLFALLCTLASAGAARAGGPDCNGNSIDDDIDINGGTVVVNINAGSLAIPDNDANGVSHSFNVTNTTGPILDVNVGVNITHTFAGEITVQITHLGQTVTIIDRPGHPTLPLGNTANGFACIMDDEGDEPIENILVEPMGGVFVSPPNYIPNQLLAAFDGMERSGLWTIKVIDAEAGDTGTIDSWSLHFETDPISDDCNGNDIPDECEDDCNGNDIPDDCDIDDATSDDCNSDGVPDECQLDLNDCNTNGVPDDCDPDMDGDDSPDDCDGCPDDADKTEPGVCGCGVSDEDSDMDGTPDCNDGCPLNAAKTEPGQCGCAVADTDSDMDGTADCNDGCPNNPGKIAPGVCGCAVADTDSDMDGTPNCNDGCPNDPNKTAPGACGCGVSDADSDGDGTPNCNDGCPNDPAKLDVGACGCGVPEDAGDDDGDGVPNCIDNCNLFNPDQADADGNGIGDACEEPAGQPVGQGSCGCSGGTASLNLLGLTMLCGAGLTLRRRTTR